MLAVGRVHVVDAFEDDDVADGREGADLELDAADPGEVLAEHLADAGLAADRGAHHAVQHAVRLESGRDRGNVHPAPRLEQRVDLRPGRVERVGSRCGPRVGH